MDTAADAHYFHGTGIAPLPLAQWHVALLLLFSCGPQDSVAYEPTPNDETHARPFRLRVATDGARPFAQDASGFVHVALYNAVLGRPIRFDSDGQPTAGGVLEVEPTSTNDTVIRLRVREGAKFHNGRDVTAHDVEFSLVRFLITRGRADQVAFLRGIDGADAVRRGQPYRRNLVAGIRVLSSTSLEIQLASRNERFLAAFADGWLSVVPMEELEGDYITWSSHPIGCGPYRVAGLPSSGVLRLERVSTTSTTLKWVDIVTEVDQGTRVDFVAFQNENPDANRLVRTISPVYEGFTGLFFNPDNALGADVRFRAALSHALVRSEVVESSPDREPLYRIFTPDLASDTVFEPPRTDVSVAARLFDAMKEDGVFSGRFTLGIPGEAGRVSGRSRVLLSAMQVQLARHGVQVNFTQLEGPTIPHESTHVAAVLAKRGTAVGDPAAVLNAFGPGGLLQRFVPDDLAHHLNRQLTVLNTAPTNSTRSASIEALEALLVHKFVVVPLFAQRKVFWHVPSVEYVGRATGIAFDIEEIRVR